MLKMPFETTHFNKNQKVWVKMMTGSMAAFVIGKFRGKYRYTEAWINWRSSTKKQQKLNEIDVSDKFAERHQLKIVEKN